MSVSDMISRVLTRDSDVRTGQQEEARHSLFVELVQRLRVQGMKVGVGVGTEGAEEFGKQDPCCRLTTTFAANVHCLGRKKKTDTGRVLVLVKTMDM